MQDRMLVEPVSWRARRLILLIMLLGVTGCMLDEIDLSAKHCPCSSGWTCDVSTNLCVRAPLRVGDSDASGLGSPGDRPDAGPWHEQDADAVVEPCPAGTVRGLSNACETCADDGDRDADGTPNCVDGCPNDARKLEPGSCGCNVLDLDADDDGAPDCLAPQGDAGVSEDAGPVLDGGDAGPERDGGGEASCDPPDTDCDGVDEDGDGSGVKGDAPCGRGLRTECDDNCPRVANPWQDDGDNDGVGDACDPTFCRSSSMLVAVGYGDQVHVSTDHGETWLRRTPGAVAQLPKTPNWEDVVHGRGTWIINNSTGQAVTWGRSVDGMTWTVHSLSEWVGVTGTQGVGYANGLWLLGSEDGRLAVSYDDGLSFSPIGMPNGWNGTSIESFAYHAGRLIAVGDAGQISYSDTPDVAASWNTRQVGMGDFKQVIVIHGVWVAAGKSTCFFSENRGEDWTSCGAPDGTYYGLSHSNGLWMLGSLSAGAPASRGRPNDFSARMFAGAGGAWPLFGDCASGRWFAGDRAGDADHGLRMSESEGADATPTRVIHGQGLPIYGIAGN